MAALTSTHEASHFDGALSAYGTARSTMEGNPLTPAAQGRRLLAGQPLRMPGDPVSEGQSFAAGALKPEKNEAAASGSLGLRPRTVFHLLQSADQEIRPERDLSQRHWAWSAVGPVLGMSPRTPTPRSTPDKSEDVAGMQRFFKQFSFPGGIGSREIPASSERRRTARKRKRMVQDHGQMSKAKTVDLVAMKHDVA